MGIKAYAVLCLVIAVLLSVALWALEVFWPYIVAGAQQASNDGLACYSLYIENGRHHLSRVVGNGSDSIDGGFPCTKEGMRGVIELHRRAYNEGDINASDYTVRTFLQLRGYRLGGHAIVWADAEGVEHCHCDWSPGQGDGLTCETFSEDLKKDGRFSSCLGH